MNGVKGKGKKGSREDKVKKRTRSEKANLTSGEEEKECELCIHRKKDRFANTLGGSSNNSTSKSV